MGFRRDKWVMVGSASLLLFLTAYTSFAGSWTDPCEEDPDQQNRIMWASTGHLNTTQLVGRLANLDEDSVRNLA